LREGFTPHEKDAFAKRVKEILDEVDILCEAHDTTPSTLPGPSRKAYYILQGIDLENLPDKAAPNSTTSSLSSQPTTSQSPIRVKNVVKLGTEFQRRLWAAPHLFRAGREEWKTLRVELELTTRQIEELCRKQGGTPAQLVDPSRRVYAWMCSMRSSLRLQEHVAALRRIAALARRIDATKAARLDVQMSYSGVLWRLRHSGERLHLTLHEGFSLASEAVLQALLQSALDRATPERRQLVDDFAASESFSGVEFELESFVTSLERQTQGQHHDLDASFDRVNESYFQARMDRPELHWNARPTTSKMGHYQPLTDTIMLSISLDRSDVPDFVVDFVMYHELLHKKHGIHTVNGRRMAHTPAFRADERQFQRYEEAERFLQRMS
jgi:hypothetical protein